MKNIFLLFLFIAFAASTSAKEKQENPNIIFILIDDQRYDFLSFLDQPCIKTVTTASTIHDRISAKK